MREFLRTGLALAVFLLVAFRAVAEEPKQVQLNVVIVEVEKPCLETLGLDKPQGSAVVLEPVGCQEFLTVRRSLGLAKILSQPRLITEVGKHASFRVGQEVPFAEESSFPGAKHVTFVPTGITVTMTPSSVDGDKHVLDVAVESSWIKNNCSGQQQLFTTRGVVTNAVAIRGKTWALAGPFAECNERALLVLITPESVVAPRPVVSSAFGVPRLPGHMPAESLRSGVVQATATVPANAPAYVAVPKPLSAKEWTFTVSADNRLLIHQAEEKQQLSVKEIAITIGKRQMAFCAEGQRIFLQVGDFQASADKVIYYPMKKELRLCGKIGLGTGPDFGPFLQGDSMTIDLNVVPPNALKSDSGRIVVPVAPAARIP